MTMKHKMKRSKYFQLDSLIIITNCLMYSWYYILFWERKQVTKRLFLPSIQYKTQQIWPKRWSFKAKKLQSATFPPLLTDQNLKLQHSAQTGGGMCPLRGRRRETVLSIQHEIDPVFSGTPLCTINVSKVFSIHLSLEF